MLHPQGLWFHFIYHNNDTHRHAIQAWLSTDNMTSSPSFQLQLPHGNDFVMIKTKDISALARRSQWSHRHIMPQAIAMPITNNDNFLESPETWHDILQKPPLSNNTTTMIYYIHSFWTKNKIYLLYAVISHSWPIICFIALSVRDTTKTGWIYMYVVIDMSRSTVPFFV